MNLSDYLSKDCVLFIDTGEKSGVLERLIEAARDAGKVGNMYRFAEAVGARELIMSTGIGLGVAVPHAKLQEIADFFIVLGIVRNGIEWDAIDEQPVRLVFLIGGPEGDQNGYLTILSGIVHFVKNSGRRQRLLEATDAEGVIAALENG